MKKENKSQFTKGRWTYDKQDRVVIAEIGEKGERAYLCELVDQDLEVLYTDALSTCTGAVDEDKVLRRVTREMHADGYLMSAAPDMYEALCDIVEQAEKTMMPIPADLADSIRVFGRAALRKAEGKPK